MKRIIVLFIGLVLSLTAFSGLDKIGEDVNGDIYLTISNNDLLSISSDVFDDITVNDASIGLINNSYYLVASGSNSTYAIELDSELNSNSGNIDVGISTLPNLAKIQITCKGNDCGRCKLKTLPEGIHGLYCQCSRLTGMPTIPKCDKKEKQMELSGSYNFIQTAPHLNFTVFTEFVSFEN